MAAKKDSLIQLRSRVGVPDSGYLCRFIVNTDQTLQMPNDPLSQSLPGEYVKMFLLGTAVCSALASALQVSVSTTALVLVTGNLVVLASLLTSRFSGMPRCSVLVGCAVVVAYVTSLSDDPNRWSSPVVFFSPTTLLVCLLLLAIRDFVIALQGVAPRTSYRVIGLSVGITLLLIYMVVVPSIEAVLEQFRERPSSFTIEELTVYEQLRIRSAKFAVFAIFTYVGACVASFVNVVAASAPRGGAIALRTSACPKCNEPIRRVDNLPIVSYLNLAGRCRNCATVIPVRYFIVELIGAAIFGSLFLFELVTGAKNVPGFPTYHYAGILWIILYTKWPVVGIYLYHCSLFSCLMMLSLMDLDRLRCPKWLAASMLLMFAGLSVVIPTIQPVEFFDQTGADFGKSMPQWAIPVVTCLTGGLVGWAVTRLIQRLTRRRSPHRLTGYAFPLSGTLIGISLGWQATVTIAVLSVLATILLFTTRPSTTRRLRFSATAILSTVALLHQPAWKWLASCW